MIDEDESSTSFNALVARAQVDRSSLAWNDFVDQIGPQIIRWCRRWCPQDADAQDLSQEILLRVYRKLPDYQSQVDHAFSAWLWMLSRHVFLDVCRRKKAIPLSNNALCNALDEQSARDAHTDNSESDVELFLHACNQVQRQVDSLQWMMFEQTDLQHNDARHVADQCGKSIAALRMNNYRIRILLRQELNAVMHMDALPSSLVRNKVSPFAPRKLR